MAFCAKCGSTMADDAAFCANCGAPRQASRIPPTEIPPGPFAQPQLAENVAGTLCYALWWLTGLLFFLIDKRPFVRFHAKQSMVVFGGLHVLIFGVTALFGISFFAGGWAGFSVGFTLYRLLNLIGLVLWIFLMIKAHQGQKFRVPYAADLAESIFGKD